MARCKLSIEILDPKEVYTVGDELRVAVHVDVDKETRCDALTLGRIWRTHGSGNVAKGKDDGKQVLFDGVWEPGEYTYEATVVLDHYPVSYHGTHVNVDWYLLARADVPWAIDPKAEQVVFLRAPPAAPQAEVPQREDYEDIPISKRGCCLFAALVPWVLIIPTVSFHRIGPVGWVVTTVLALLSLVPVAVFLLRRQVLKRLGAVEFGVVPRRVPPGGNFQLGIRLTPTKDLLLNGITVTLTCQESATSGSGSNRTTYTQEVLEEVLTVVEDHRIAAGETWTGTLPLPIPADAPATFKAVDNEIEWEIEIHLDIPGCPDLKVPHVITVLHPGQEEPT